MRTLFSKFVAALIVGTGVLSAAQATTPTELLAGYAVAGDAARGQQFFNSKHGQEWSCASCHGNPPSAQGKHAGTGKAIAPLAPAFSPERFTDTGKVEKWFRRNCKDVLARECSTGEKADVLAWLLTLKR